MTVYLMSMYVYPRAFSLSPAVMLEYFLGNRGAFDRVVFACLCVYFQHILWDQIMLFCSLRAHKIFRGIYNDLLVW